MDAAILTNAVILSEAHFSAAKGPAFAHSQPRAFCINQSPCRIFQTVILALDCKRGSVWQK